MPIYEYNCSICSSTFEKLRPMSQMDDEAHCPDCGGDSRRQLSVFASFSAGSDGSDGESVPVGGGSGGGSGGGCCGGSCGAC